MHSNPIDSDKAGEDEKAQEHQPNSTAPEKTVHVAVPEAAWRRARKAALDSGMSFKGYVARLLLSAHAIPQSSDSGLVCDNVQGGGRDEGLTAAEADASSIEGGVSQSVTSADRETNQGTLE